MRFREFKLTEEQLAELKMSPSSLGAFSKSPVAKGIKAGFEAELVFPGIADPDSGDMEPDYDEDDRVYGIDSIIDFFSNDDHGWGSSHRVLERLRSQLEEAYWEYADEEMMSNFREEAEQLIREYIEENDWDADEHIHEYLVSELGLTDEEAEQVMIAGQKATSTRDLPKEYLEARKAADSVLDTMAEDSFNSQDGTYDKVLEQYRDDYAQPDEREFLSSMNLDYMSEVADQYELDWPIWTNVGGGEGGYSENAAEQLANDLTRTLGYPVKVSSGYHAQRKDTTHWYFEPDGSLDADDSDDMPVEIVSPPMELETCLEALEDFFEWAKGHDAYTNKSTGFHMGVSLPTVGGKVDFVKLALFLGDEYVLQEFGRQAVAFTESAMKKMRNRLKGNDERVSDAMNLMRKGLIDIAHNTIASDEGFGKYTSINPKGDYIEFRSAGNTDYQADISKLRNTLLRYAQAMVVAADPALEKQEYYKKLYKLIAPATGDSSMDLFARFASGSISKEELKTQWATAALKTAQPEDEIKATRRAELAKRIQTGSTPTRWKVYGHPQSPLQKQGIEVEAWTENEAYEKAIAHWRINTNGLKAAEWAKSNSWRAERIAAQPKTEPVATPAPQEPAQQTSSNGVPMWEIYNRNSNAPLYRFADHNQTAAWSQAQQYLSNNGYPRERWSEYSIRPMTDPAGRV